MNKLLAGSLAVLILGSAPLGAFAEDPAPQKPTQTTVVSYTTQTFTQSPMELRGHLTNVPKGTIMMIKVDHPVSTYSSKVGDPVTATVEGDIYVSNKIVIPAGSQVEGAITGVMPAQHMGKHGALEMQFHALKTPSGTVVPIRAHVVTEDQSGIIKGGTAQARVFKTMGAAALPTAAGTLMGTAAGSLMGSVGGGAIFGLAAGGLGGLGYALYRTGDQVEVPAGSRMSIVLDQEVTIN